MRDPSLPLLVIYTGGTLGMVQTPVGLAPGADFEGRLRRAIAGLPPRQQAALAEFDMLSAEPPIDSSAVMPVNWQWLAGVIAERYRRYAGIVVLHGTDTLAWTASSLAYQLQGIDCPVVLTGAMRPLESPNSDALTNIEAALRFAALPELQEVALCFAGRLMRGVRSSKWRSQAVDAFASPNYPLLGQSVDHSAILFPERGLQHHQRGLARFTLPDYASLPGSAVVRIPLWPGIEAWQLEAWLGDGRVRGALLEIWGRGNVPDDPALLGVIAQACGEGKLVAAISQCPHDGIAIGEYAAGQPLGETGVLAGDDMTPEAAWTKLYHLLAQPLEESERRRRFLTPAVGERHTPAP